MEKFDVKHEIDGTVFHGVAVVDGKMMHVFCPSLGLRSADAAVYSDTKGLAIALLREIYQRAVRERII